MADKPDKSLQNRRSTAVKKKAMIEALKTHYMVISVACKEAGVGRDFHYDWLKKDKRYKAQVEAAGEYLIDLAEQTIQKSIMGGNSKDARWFLETKGKVRGYVKKQEIEHTGSEPIKINVIMPKEEKKSD